MVTPAAKRKAVGRLKEGFGMSERRACKATGCCRMTVRYETSRPDDREVRERMKAIAQERRRFGYRRLLVMLRREGLVVNHKKLFRLYREEKLAVRRRGGRTPKSPGRHRPSSPAPSICDGRSRCAMPKAPRQRPSLHPPSRAQPTPETNSKLDRNWGQRQTTRTGSRRPHIAANGRIADCRCWWCQSSHCL